MGLSNVMLVGLLGLLGLLGLSGAFGCGGRVTDDSGVGAADGSSSAEDDPSAFVLCPTTLPATGSRCTDEGNQCEYYVGLRCEGIVVCTSGQWAARTCGVATTK